MAKKILSFLVVLFLWQTNFSVFANSLYRAVVKDSTTQQTLQGVIILVNNIAIATTNNNGFFSIKKNDFGNSTVILSLKYFGYKTFQKQIDLSKNDFSELPEVLYLSALSHELNAVTISGSKFEKRLNEETVSIEVVKPKQMQDVGITQMDDMLKRIPGVDVVDGQANIRGGSGWSYGAGSRVLVMVDDMPMLTSDAGDVKWDFLPIENCEQVEVLKGAASALYGSSALNGVINFRTAFARNAPQTNIVIQQGVYDSPNKSYENWSGNDVLKYHGANFFHSQKFGQLDVVVGGNYFTDDSYLQGNYNTRGRLNTNLRYRFKKIKGLSVGLNMNAQKAQGSSFFIWGADDKATFIHQVYRPDSTAYYKPSGGVDTPKTTLSFSKITRFNIDPYITYNTSSGYKFKLQNRFFNTININSTDQGSNAKFYYSELQGQKMYAHQIGITSGLVANYSDVNSQLYGNHTADNFAFYLQMEKKFFNKLWFTLGGRYESFRVDTFKTNSKPLGRIGLNYQLAKATFIRSSIGMGYRAPTIAEKFVSTNVSAIKIIPNPTLQPESGWSGELGIKQNFAIKKLLGMIDLSAFYTRYYNMMEFTFLLNQVSFQSQNISNTVVKGLDLSLFTQYQIKKVKVSFHSGATYVIPRDLDFNKLSSAEKKLRYSDTLTNILKYRYTTSWKSDVELQWDKFTLGSYVRYNTYIANIDPELGAFFRSIAQYTQKWGHKDTWIIDARVQYQMNKNASLAVIVKNILNFEYTERPGEIAPVRSFTMQFIYKF